MIKKQSRNLLRLKRHKRSIKHLRGCEEKPRVSIFKSLKNISVQVIDDDTGKTIIGLGLLTKSIKDKFEKKNVCVKNAEELGKIIAVECTAKNIKKVVFDRNGYKYHGIVKALADGLRAGGLVL